MLLSPLRGKAPRQGEQAGSKSLVAPIRGWNARDPEAAMGSGWALYLRNWWPTPTSVQLRKGAINHKTGLTGVVKSLVVWNGRSGVSKLFACTDLGVFDATTAGIAGATVAVLTNGAVQSVNFGTTGNSYAFLVNGTDSLWRYDGTTWVSVGTYAVTPTSGGGVLTTANVINLAVHKRALFLIEKNSLDFFYFPADTIAGTVSRFPLGALFSEGGSLVAMGTWTLDGGQGLDDYAVFVTSEGQVAIYRGTDPASAATWALQGVYHLGKPLSKKCFTKYGGDVIYLSRDGAFPLSRALQSTNITATIAVTDNISSAFAAAARSYGNNFGWQGVLSYTDSLLLFNVPTAEFSTSEQYAMNTKNGAWCQILNWNAFCFAVVNNQLYMGMAGKVAKAWIGGNDFGGPIQCFAKSAFDYLGLRARQKKVNLIRPVLRIDGVTAVDAAVDMDFKDGTNYGPTVFNYSTGGVWNTDVWDGPAAIWGGTGTTKLDWITVSAPDGYCAATRLRVLSQDATVEWTATDLVFETGAIRG